MGEAAQACHASKEELSGLRSSEAAEDDGAGALPAPSEVDALLDDGDRWCVDLGDAIVVRSTCELAAAFEAGELSRRSLVWREGHAIWEPLDHFPELMSRVAAVESLRPPAMEPVAEVPCVPTGPRGRRPRSVAFSSAFAIGLVLGVLIALPFAWRSHTSSVDRLIPRVDATTRAAAAMVPRD